LADHENKLRQVVGTGTATVRSGQLFIDGTLTSATEAGRMVLGLHADKVPLQASVGVAPGQQAWLSEGETVHVNSRDLVVPAGGAALIESGKLRETSLTPLGSDSETRVDIAAAQKQRNRTMGQDPNQPSYDDAILPAGTEDRLDAAAAITPDGYIEAAEKRQRLISCWDSTRQLTGEDNKQRARELRASATRGEMGLEAYRNGMADLMVDDRPRGPAIHSSSQDTGSHPSVLQAAFCHAAGLPNREQHFDERTLEASDRQYPGGLGLGEMLLQCAHEGGYDGRGVIRGSNLGAVLRAAFSTHQATTLLSTTGNKFLRDGFNTVESVWKAISKTRPVKDFKTITSFRLTADLEFELVPPAGEITHGTAGQESYTNKADTYAKMLALTRTDIINDDLGAFDDIRNRLGRGGALKLNSVFWAAFLDNAAFFTTGRGNLIEGASGALASDGVALAAAEKAFLDLRTGGETDLMADTHPLGIEPALLLMPTALGVTGRKLYVSQEIRDTTSDTVYQTENLYHNRFKPLVSAYIGANNTNGSDTGWYLAADPANLPLMEVCFLDGMESPTIESSDADFSTLGIQSRGYWDFGCTPAEWRAGVFSDGTD